MLILLLKIFGKNKYVNYINNDNYISINLALQKEH